MKSLLIVFATTEGHTRKVADFIAREAAALGWSATAHQLGAGVEQVPVSNFEKLIVAASVHLDHHQPAIEEFVRRYGASLCDNNAAFLSVSLSAAGDAEDRYVAWQYARDLLSHSTWNPAHVDIVPGALKFSESPFFKSWALRRLMFKKRIHRDRNEDYDFTDWDELARFVKRFLLAQPATGRSSSALQLDASENRH